jgi:hydrogenase expression/formation protein HypD
MDKGEAAAVAEQKREHIHRIAETIPEHINLMEVCGTHTVQIRKHGIHSMLPENMHLISGPGCPVCVTPSSYIDNALQLIENQNVSIATFGDMVKVPGTKGTSLSYYMGSDSLHILYSPMELLGLAAESKKDIVFLGIGFETTIPTIASVFLRAFDAGIDNLSLYPAFKTISPALRALLQDEESDFQGFILPGHVSVIIGEQAYSFLETEYGFPGVITGFEALDILSGVESLLMLIAGKKYAVKNCYTRAVRPEGNKKALAAMNRFLEPCDTQWRGLGLIKRSGMGIRSEYEVLDAVKRYSLPDLKQHDPPGCLCGRVIQGKASPQECKHFGTRCTPEQPIGPCMVSSEGTCAAYLRYGEIV